jgi:hypothetical protein
MAPEPELPATVIITIEQGGVMAKYTATISEDLRQKILALPRGVKFGDFMEKAINVFTDELEKNPNLGPENFIITVSARKDKPARKP